MPVRVAEVDTATAAVHPGVDLHRLAERRAAGRSEPGADPSGWTLPPLARVGTGADVASAVTFFATADGAFCNGTILLVDGGMRAAVRASSVAREAGR